MAKLESIDSMLETINIRLDMPLVLEDKAVRIKNLEKERDVIKRQEKAYAPRTKQQLFKQFSL